MKPLIHIRETYSPSGNISSPTLNKFQVGDLMWDGYSESDGYVYELRMIDPDEVDYSEKELPPDVVLSWPSTTKYIEWYKSGFQPMPITCVYNVNEKRFLSTNRRRLLAAREAGINQIPAWMELGRYKDLSCLST